jgi:hypothetical protein
MLSVENTRPIMEQVKIRLKAWQRLPWFKLGPLQFYQMKKKDIAVFLEKKENSVHVRAYDSDILDDYYYIDIILTKEEPSLHNLFGQFLTNVRRQVKMINFKTYYEVGCRDHYASEATIKTVLAEAKKMLWK